ncbi:MULTISPECIES: S1 family peptidase [Halorussus]|uniref:S1 family peptidase n=1 Tax=Halorussus TaxID=1070314 RepID=UPI00209FDB1D|nr:S1 family peptidase [Halorussus vallis]USZ75086.1 S1 family peptidase [Halorussus vallis]
MPSSEDFEHLLDCRNVLAVDYDEETDTVTVFVSQKLDPDDLDEADDVTKQVPDRNVEVVDAGYGEERDGFDALGVVEIPDAQHDRKDRHRPVVAGVSEINADSTAATAGPYPARVTDPDAPSATWAEGVAADETVRLSNNHVYARVNAAEFGDAIVQPSPRDGGSLPDDKVGELRGYVPIEEGAVVDVAARSADPERESPEYHELPVEWPTAIRREGYRELRGETVTKTGRTTGVSSASVQAVGASVRVNFGPEHGTLTVRDQLIAGPMSKGGDSGSPVFRDENGELVGLLFAGSANQTIFNKVANVERELGVELLTSEEGGGGGTGGGDGEGGSGGGDGTGGNGGSAPGEGDGADPPTYRRTFEETVTLSMSVPELVLESLTVTAPPRPGGTVEATATVAGTAPGTCWLEVEGTRLEFDLTADDERDGRYVRQVSVGVEAPDSAGETFDVSVTGGYVV